MIPLRQTCLRCESGRWPGNPYKYYDCGMKQNSFFQRQTEECKRREVTLLVKQAIGKFK